MFVGLVSGRIASGFEVWISGFAAVAGYVVLLSVPPINAVIVATYAWSVTSEINEPEVIPVFTAGLSLLLLVVCAWIRGLLGRRRRLRG